MSRGTSYHFEVDNVFWIEWSAGPLNPLIELVKETIDAFSTWAHERPVGLDVMRLDKARNEVERVKTAFGALDNKLREVCDMIDVPHIRNTDVRYTGYGTEHVTHSTTILGKSTLEILCVHLRDESLRCHFGSALERFAALPPEYMWRNPAVMEPVRKPGARDLVIRSLLPGTDERMIRGMLRAYGRVIKVTILEPLGPCSRILALVSFENPVRALELYRQYPDM
jgi:hypothetical protein